MRRIALWSLGKIVTLATLGCDLVEFSLATVRMFRDDALEAGYEL